MGARTDGNDQWKVPDKDHYANNTGWILQYNVSLDPSTKTETL